MREIKFRAWFYDGEDLSSGWWIDIDGLNEEFKDKEYGETIFGMYGECFPNDDCLIINQFTGLKDKNGKEIYEGDIVSKTCGILKENRYDRISIVEFDREDEKTGLWELKTVKFKAIGESEEDKTGFVYYEPFGLACGVEKREVIGNIYENPELLNK